MFTSRIYSNGRVHVATYKTFDKADEFRIEIVGRFAGDAVEAVRLSWKQALDVTTPRKLTVDITRLSGYDTAGRKLLNEIYRHGTDFAARTPSSLVFLNEISSLPRNSPTPMPTAVKPQRTRHTNNVRPLAAGQ